MLLLFVRRHRPNQFLVDEQFLQHHIRFNLALGKEILLEVDSQRFSVHQHSQFNLHEVVILRLVLSPYPNLCLISCHSTSCTGGAYGTTEALFFGGAWLCGGACSLFPHIPREKVGRYAPDYSA
ncbi:hypothetical protein Ddc_22295 [Ditylenchus destructor]|nr:hypothetical protein Ddc_22295 [Ditylenchus destructor]